MGKLSFGELCSFSLVCDVLISHWFVWLRYDLGQGVSVVSTTKRVDDGSVHTVSVVR